MPLNEVSLVSTVLWLTFLSSSTETEVSNRWGWAISKDMHPHAILFHLLGQVIILMPQEFQVVSVVVSHQESIKHLLDIGSDCDEVFPEPNQHSHEGIILVGTCQHHRVQGDTMVLCA